MYRCMIVGFFTPLHLVYRKGIRKRGDVSLFSRSIAQIVVHFLRRFNTDPSSKKGSSEGKNQLQGQEGKYPEHSCPDENEYHIGQPAAPVFAPEKDAKAQERMKGKEK